MRFLLINPFYSISETPSPPLGLAFLAGALEAAGVNVKVLDFVVYPYSKSFLSDALDDFSPDIVGVTSVTMTFNHAIEIVKDVKHLHPDIITIMGGPHVSFCPMETMEAFPELDLIVLGEGEETLVELVCGMEKGQKIPSIPGLVYRKGPEIINNGFRKQLVDVNTLPFPARNLLPLGRYRALGMAISMTTSRGCPFGCIFCVGRKMVGAKVRYRDPEKAVAEMEYLCSLDFPQINMADDLFTANAKHAIGICDEILKRHLVVKWTSFARVDTVTREVLSKMREAGCHTVSFGIESANADILKTIKKGITIDQAVRAVELCNETGMTPHASFILGLPGETPETLKETIDFGERLKSMGVYHGFHLLAPFPGTEVREKKDFYGIRILTNNWSEYHANRAIVETASVSKKMMDDSVVDWEVEYNHVLDDIKRRIPLGEATEEEANSLHNLERIVLIYDLMMARSIEETGTWKVDSPVDSPPVFQNNALSVLSNRLSGVTKYASEDIYNALTYTLNRGNLTYRLENGTIHWQWVDFL